MDEQLTENTHIYIHPDKIFCLYHSILTRRFSGRFVCISIQILGFLMLVFSILSIATGVTLHLEFLGLKRDNTTLNCLGPRNFDRITGFDQADIIKISFAQTPTSNPKNIFDSSFFTDPFFYFPLPTNKHRKKSLTSTFVDNIKKDPKEHPLLNKILFEVNKIQNVKNMHIRHRDKERESPESEAVLSLIYFSGKCPITWNSTFEKEFFKAHFTQGNETHWDWKKAKSILNKKVKVINEKNTGTTNEIFVMNPNSDSDNMNGINKHGDLQKMNQARGIGSNPKLEFSFSYLFSDLFVKMISKLSSAKKSDLNTSSHLAKTAQYLYAKELGFLYLEDSTQKRLNLTAINFKISNNANCMLGLGFDSIWTKYLLHRPIIANSFRVHFNSKGFFKFVGSTEKPFQLTGSELPKTLSGWVKILFKSLLLTIALPGIVGIVSRQMTLPSLLKIITFSLPLNFSDPSLGNNNNLLPNFSPIFYMRETFNLKKLISLTILTIPSAIIYKSIGDRFIAILLIFLVWNIEIYILVFARNKLSLRILSISFSLNFFLLINYLTIFNNMGFNYFFIFGTYTLQLSVMLLLYAYIEIPSVKAGKITQVRQNNTLVFLENIFMTKDEQRRLSNLNSSVDITFGQQQR
ncbi:hypothetical protein M0812_20752 [Anaeramoeba flamelloides]|uniref:Uncharacterized protein n=1 Tax=Anaeramoeba flamelloides TaxID=1746091 RepID=A0AAV7YPW5_9EUKA|nr:hypothetical protein M0812_20752 [Anaeramoeba flamelloides]